MAISDTITSMYENVGEVYDTITNVTLPEHKNIENIPRTIRDSYLQIMNNGIDVIWDNWEKVTGSGSTLTLSQTTEAPMKLEIKGNTYQNGTPTPNSPVPIQVVSGSNTIKVANSDNTSYQEYSISLGSVELCKIGNYQDIIFKNEPNTTYYDSDLEDNAWYLKKQIGKITANGSEDWYTSSGTTQVMYKGGANYERNISGLPCNLLSTIRIPNNNLYCDNTGFSLNDWKALLSNTNLIIYGVLSTATYTKITDSTLISELESLKQAKSYDTQTNVSQLNNNLGFIINATALKGEE